METLVSKSKIFRKADLQEIKEPIKPGENLGVIRNICQSSPASTDAQQLHFRS
jgi:hypothetical protein